MRIVRKQPDGSLTAIGRPQVQAAYTSDWSLAPRDPASEFYVELRGRVGGPAAMDAVLRSLDWCGSDIPKPSGAVADPGRSVRVESVETTDRFTRYRNPTLLQLTSEVVPEAPLEVPEDADRQLVFAEVGGHSEISVTRLSETRRRNAGHAFTGEGGILRDTVLVLAPNDGRGAGDAHPVRGIGVHFEPLGPARPTA